MPVFETLALLAWAAKRAYDQHHRKAPPACAVCGSAAERATNCCNTVLCNDHLHQWGGHLPGRCPLPGCGKYVGR